MNLPLSLLLTLAGQCSPTVAPETLLSVVHAESGFDPFVIGVNGNRPQRISAKSAPQAAAIAKELIASGQSIDLGLAQINSRNLRPLNLTVDEAFDPCLNLSAGGRVLTQGYLAASQDGGPVQAALLRAFSIYNTGTPNRGFANGYVTRVTASAARLVPALRLGAPAMLIASPVAAHAKRPPAAQWDVFATNPAPGLGSDAIMVFKQ